MITLKPWDPSMKEDLIRICNGTEREFLSDRIPEPYTEQDADCWLDKVSKAEGIDGIYRAICLGDSVIGEISVERKPDVYRIDGEIGYFLLPRFRNRNIMTEAVNLIIPEAREQLGLVRITGLIYEQNVASRRVLEKNGFYLGSIQKKAAIKDGRMYDLCIYGKILDEEDEKTNYATLRAQISNLTQDVEDITANLANVSSLLYNNLQDVNWVGFYLAKGETLVLGPFMGKPARVYIPFGRGVCGKAAKTRETQVVPNVYSFHGYISCDGDTVSEIVIPLVKDDTVIGVLDIDSPFLDRFSDEDQKGLENVARLLEELF